MSLWITALATALSGLGLGLHLWLFSARIAHSQAPSEQWFLGLSLAIGFGLVGLALMQLPANRKQWAARSIGQYALIVAIIAVFSGVYAVFPNLQTGTPAAGLAFLDLLAFVALAKCMRGDNTSMRRYAWQQQLALVLSAMMTGAILLSGLVSPTAAPIIGKIAVLLILLAIVAQVFADLAVKSKSGRSNSLTLVKIAMFSIGFAMPFVIININLKLALMVAVFSAIGLLLQRWLLFSDGPQNTV
jgi:hypothetical protein